MLIRLSQLLVLLLLIVSSAAWAHKVIFDVYQSGSVIEGELGFSNGDMAVAQRISVTDGAGVEIDQVYTDEEGFFVYTPATQDHLNFEVDLGAGHVAEATINWVPKSAEVVTLKGAENTEIAKLYKPSTVAAAEQASVVSEVQKLSAQVRQMRHELRAYKEKNDLQSVLGGIGYILGLVGLGYYLAARRKLRGD